MLSKARKSADLAQMRQVLSGALQRLGSQIDPQSALPGEPIDADPYVVSSLLRKSIRRGERQIAQQAALAFFKMRGSAIWRRFMVIVFEDVGVGCVDALTATVAAASDTAWRKSLGGDLCIAAHIAGVLADAPKDRSADYLGVAKDHPALREFAKAMVDATVNARLSKVRDRALTLPQRGIAAWFASGFESHCEDRGRDDLNTLLASFGKLGVPEELETKTKDNAFVTIPIFVQNRVRPEKAFDAY